MVSMKPIVSVDRAGRVVLPKRVRDKLRLEPGDQLLIDDEGEQITLRPIRPQAALKKELGVWVHHGSLSSDSIPDLIDSVRLKRLRELSE